MIGHPGGFAAGWVGSLGHVPRCWFWAHVDTARQDMTSKTYHTKDLPAPLWTTGDVAKFLRCSKRQIPRLREDGLPSIRVGALVRFVPEQVMAWLGRAEPATCGDERAQQLADVAASGDEDAADCATADLEREFPNSPPGVHRERAESASGPLDSKHGNPAK